MRRLTGFVLAAVLAATSCFAAPAKIATQEWVKQALAGIGVRVSTATVATNVTTSATTGAVVTNLTFTSPYTCAEVPQCRAISFTVSTAKTAYRQAMTPKTRSLLNLLFASVYADGEIDTTVYLTIESGYWTDAAGNIISKSFASFNADNIAGFVMNRLVDHGNHGLGLAGTGQTHN